ncbi:MAG: histidine phosphatase family protein, partial [Candidatus Levybacteria bacterium]|nr:histidine phosphatase family protein [Candidatus Levybacteria bacterium]
MNKLTTIYLVRHAQSETNIIELRRKIYGQIESIRSPLTKLGVRQSQDLVKKIKDIHLDLIMSSDMERTRQTAEIIARKRGMSVEVGDGIRERSLYDYADTYEGKTYDQIRDEVKADLKALDTESQKMKYKHSDFFESAEEAAIRIFNFLKEVAIAYFGKTILIVSHGNLIRSFLTYIGYVSFDDLPGGSLENTGYVVLETDG